VTFLLKYLIASIENQSNNHEFIREKVKAVPMKGTKRSRMKQPYPIPYDITNLDNVAAYIIVAE
jgi:hypothetical protein